MQWNWDIDKIPQDETNINTMGEIYKNAFQKIRQISYQTCGLHYIDKLLNEIDDNLHPLAKVVINTRVTQLSTSKNLDTQRNLSTTEKRELIKSIVLFNDLKEDHISQLISCLHSHTYSEGERIIKQYAEGDRLYIIVEGKAQVEVENMAGQSQIVSYLTDNDFFGEIALLTSSERTASIRACTSTTVLYLKRKDFDAFLDLNPGDKEKIIESLNRLRLIKNIPLFRDLDSTLINTFTSQMVQSKFKLNDQIITQGEIGDQFYIILNGECRVHVDRDDKKDHQVAQLSTGEYFGEIALLKDIPRTASVSANSESVTVLTLKKQNFLEAIESHKTLISDFNTASNRRIVEMMH
jgi:CRP-like cAMP-binding protein